MKMVPYVNIRTLRVVLVALLLAGCNQMQASPVVPSSTNPMPAPVTNPTAPRQTYTVSLSANGDGLVGLWQSTMVVSAVPAGQTPPLEVTLNCGNGSAQQALAGFLGLKIVSCTFGAVGDYTVTANVIAPNTETFSVSTVVSVHAAPPPPPTPPISLSINAERISGTATSAEWRFSVVVSEPLTNVVWDFGDGGGAEGQTQQHRYVAEGTYTVRMSADSREHGPVTKARDIAVTFK